MGEELVDRALHVGLGPGDRRGRPAREPGGLAGEGVDLLVGYVEPREAIVGRPELARAMNLEAQEEVDPLELGQHVLE
jgi:hypothetical protein